MHRLRFLSAIAVSFLLSPLGFAEDKPLFENLPQDFSVYAVGTVRGIKPVKVQLDESKAEVTQAEVVVNNPDKPVVLALTAYAPVVWRVGRTKDTEIAAVLVSGHHGQALIGVKKETPLAISTQTEEHRFPPFYAVGATDQLLAMNETIKKLVGREIDFFENKPVDGVFYLGEKPKDSESIEYSSDLKVNGVAEPPRLLVGLEGLKTLVEEKKLRPATETDIDAWVDKASEKFKRFNPKLRVRNPMVVSRTYVVLEKITLPEKLTGRDARSFIIPENVPFPEGVVGDSSFYSMDGTKKENVVTAMDNTKPSAQEARFVFNTLDRNKDNFLDADEWNGSKTIRNNFQKSGISLKLPADFNAFLTSYPSFRIVPNLRLPGERE